MAPVIAKALRNIKSSREESDEMDALMRVVKTIHSAAVNSNSVSEADLAKQRASQEKFSKLITPSQTVDYERVEVGNVACEWVRPEFAHNTHNIIMYCHGGGYTAGGLGYARILAAKMALATGYEVFTFDYRLAPENPYPAAIEDGMMVWDYLMNIGYGARNVTVAGDSAGGNLALEIGLKLKAQGRFLPRAYVLFSPWTDMTMSGSAYTTWADKDPLLTADYIRAVRGAYAGDADYSSPDYSPINGDLSGWPPTLIQVGSNEILRSDSENLSKKLKNLDSYVKLEVYKGGWHVFQQMPIAMAGNAIKNVDEFLRGVL